MSSQRQTIVVCGATGTQGGHVIDALMSDLDRYDIVAISRNPKSSKCLELSSKGATVLEADLLDLPSLRRAFRGADAVFGMTQPWNESYTSADAEKEVRQGSNIVRACVDCGVGHLVFSSAARLDDSKRTGIPHVDSKMDVEYDIAKSRLKYTFLRPVQFMDNVGLPFLPVSPSALGGGGWIRGFIDGDARVGYVAARDIGLVAKAAFDDPNGYAGRSVSLIGDLVTGHELADAMTKVRGGGGDRGRFRYWAIPRWVIRVMSAEFYKMRLGFEAVGSDEEALRKIQEKVEECRRINPSMLSMEEYLKFAGWGSRELSQPRRLSYFVPLLLASAAASVASSFLLSGSMRSVVRENRSIATTSALFLSTSLGFRAFIPDSK